MDCKLLLLVTLAVAFPEIKEAEASRKVIIHVPKQIHYVHVYEHEHEHLEHAPKGEESRVKGVTKARPIAQESAPLRHRSKGHRYGKTVKHRYPGGPKGYRVSDKPKHIYPSRPVKPVKDSHVKPVKETYTKPETTTKATYPAQGNYGKAVTPSYGNSATSTYGSAGSSVYGNAGSSAYGSPVTPSYTNFSPSPSSGTYGGVNSGTGSVYGSVGSSGTYGNPSTSLTGRYQSESSGSYGYYGQNTQQSSNGQGSLYGQLSNSQLNTYPNIYSYGQSGITQKPQVPVVVPNTNSAYNYAQQHTSSFPGYGQQNVKPVYEQSSYNSPSGHQPVYSKDHSSSSTNYDKGIFNFKPQSIIAQELQSSFANKGRPSFAISTSSFNTGIYDSSQSETTNHQASQGYTGPSSQYVDGYEYADTRDILKTTDGSNSGSSSSGSNSSGRYGTRTRDRYRNYGKGKYNDFGYNQEYDNRRYATEYTQDEYNNARM